MDVETAIRLLGRVARTDALVAHGISPDRIERVARAGRIERLRRGWYATDDAHADVVSAVRAGGSLTCVSALSALGAWTMPDTRLHVRVARGTHRTPGDGIRVHWSDTGVSGFPMDSPAEALRMLIGCADLRSAVVTVDSMLNKRILPLQTVERICAGSGRGALILERADGRAESGHETLARLALKRLRIDVTPQFRIAGVGRVDLLIGDRLVLELDGETWHDFETDRARDRLLVGRGYVAMRASYSQVMNGWPVVEAQIVELVRRREHLWRAPHRALGHAPRPYRAAPIHGVATESTSRG